MPSAKFKTHISLLDILNSSASERIKFLKLIDQTVGFLLIYILLWLRPRTVGQIPPKIKKVLLVRPGGIGDAVWLLPLIKVLKQKTGCSIDVLCEGRNKAVFDFCLSSLEHLWTYDGARGNIIKELKNQTYDCVIDTEQYHNFSAIFAYLPDSSVRVGFDTVAQRSELYTHKVFYSHHAQEYKMFLDLFNVLTPISVTEYLNEIDLDLSRIDSAFFPHGLKGQAYVAVYIGASVKERFWGSEKFIDLCEQIIEKGDQVVLVGGKDDRQKADQIKASVRNERLFDLVGQISLAQTVLVLKRARVTIGADSGIMHLAAVVHCPAVWLFGSGIQEKWLPEFGKNEPINLNLSCSPCTSFGYTPSCPYQVRCLREMTVKGVLGKIGKLMS